MCKYVLYVLLASIAIAFISSSIYCYSVSSSECELKSILSRGCKHVRSNYAEYYSYTMSCVVEINGVEYEGSSSCNDYINDDCEQCKSKYKIGGAYICTRLKSDEYELYIGDITKYHVLSIVLLIFGMMFLCTLIGTIFYGYYRSDRRCQFNIFRSNIDNNVSDENNENSILL